MTSRPWAVRVRSASSSSILTGLDPALSIEAFQQLLRNETGISPVNQEILVGYPPTVLQITNDVSAAISVIPGLRNGEALTVRKRAHEETVRQTDSPFDSLSPFIKRALITDADAMLHSSTSSNAAGVQHSAPAFDSRQPDSGEAAAANSNGAHVPQPMDEDADMAQAIAASLADQSGGGSDTPFTATAPVRPESPPSIPGLPPGSMMVRRVVEGDNSCLFNAVGYVIHGSRGLADNLRALIARTVADDPETFTEAWLERPNDEYCAWILDESNWGGAIELAILAKHYRVEIAAYDIQSQRCDLYGEGAGYNQRVMVLYDGIHYDALSLAAFPDAPEALDTSVFPSESELASGAARSASEVVAVAHAARAYTDTAGFTLRCSVCQVGLMGERDARIHAEQTGHQNFQEY